MCRLDPTERCHRCGRYILAANTCKGEPPRAVTAFQTEVVNGERKPFHIKCLGAADVKTTSTALQPAGRPGPEASAATTPNG